MQGSLQCDAPSPMPARVSILSRTNGLDEEHRHDIAPIALGPGQLFELDQWVVRVRRTQARRYALRMAFALTAS